MRISSFIREIRFVTRVLDMYMCSHFCDQLDDLTMRMNRIEGVKGFYKGLTAYLIHVTPNICIVFLIYEKFSPTTASQSSPRPVVRHESQEKEKDAAESKWS